jgi:hypothetical protein
MDMDMNLNININMNMNMNMDMKITMTTTLTIYMYYTGTCTVPDMKMEMNMYRDVNCDGTSMVGSTREEAYLQYIIKHYCTTPRKGRGYVDTIPFRSIVDSVLRLSCEFTTTTKYTGKKKLYLIISFFIYHEDIPYNITIFCFNILSHFFII